MEVVCNFSECEFYEDGYCTKECLKIDNLVCASNRFVLKPEETEETEETEEEK